MCTFHLHDFGNMTLVNHTRISTSCIILLIFIAFSSGRTGATGATGPQGRPGMPGPMGPPGSVGHGMKKDSEGVKTMAGKLALLLEN